MRMTNSICKTCIHFNHLCDEDKECKEGNCAENCLHKNIFIKETFYFSHYDIKHCEGYEKSN